MDIVSSIVFIACPSLRTCYIVLKTTVIKQPFETIKFSHIVIEGTFSLQAEMGEIPPYTIYHIASVGTLICICVS